MKITNAKLDSKSKLTPHSENFEDYHDQETDDEVIVLEPRELTASFRISAKTLAMMDASVNNMKAGKVSAEEIANL